MNKKQDCTPDARDEVDLEKHAGGASKPSVRPGIIDSVIDQNGSQWILFGTQSRSCWFSLADLQLNEREVLARLSGPGMTFLTAGSRHDFKEVIEAHGNYRDGFVASHPGWIGGHYVFGDQTVVASEADEREVIVAFPGDNKFTPVGSLEAWLEAIGPIVSHQPLALFALAYACVGPVLRFAPPNALNPQSELVGEPECGKSTLAIVAASVWAGDPNSEAGGGETWDLTVNALDPIKIADSDSLLLLDEGNLAGTDSRDQKEVIRKTVFKMASKGGRKRYTDTRPVPTVHVALLSTSNVPLRKLVQATGAVAGAQQSRMVTIEVDSQHGAGVLAHVPDGFATSKAAIEELRCAANENYGVAGRAFIAELVKAAADEEKLRRRIEKLVAQFLGMLGSDGIGRGTARRANTFAITYAAGILARKFGILPQSWGKLGPALMEVYRSLDGNGGEQKPASALDRVREYARANRKRLIKASDMSAPLDESSFRRAAGFVKRERGHDWLLIPAEGFRRSFADHDEVMRELKRGKRAKTENGTQKKLTIKTPTGICAAGRVYCVRISS